MNSRNTIAARCDYHPFQKMKQSLAAFLINEVRKKILLFLLIIAFPEFAFSNTAECDRLAASPFDETRPHDLHGTYFSVMNASSAILACEQAVRTEPENSRMMFQLARAYQRAGRDSEAYSLYYKAAEAGHPESMANVALMFLNGTGIKADQAEGLRWCRKSVEAGSSIGMRYMGSLHQIGLGVPKNEQEALHWYRQSAEAGNSDGMVYLAWMLANGKAVEVDFEKAKIWYRKAAEAGHSDGMVQLGSLYANEKVGKTDFTEAASWYRKAADAGNIDGMLNLAFFYVQGKGVKADNAEAVRLFTSATEKGIAW